MARPPPPIAAVGGEAGIAGLGDGAAKGIEDAGVLAGARFDTELIVQFVALAAGEVWDGGYAERNEIGFDGFADAGEVSEFAGFGGAHVEIVRQLLSGGMAGLFIEVRLEAVQEPSGSEAGLLHFGEGLIF